MLGEDRSMSSANRRGERCKAPAQKETAYDQIWSQVSQEARPVKAVQEVQEVQEVQAVAAVSSCGEVIVPDTDGLLGLDCQIQESGCGAGRVGDTFSWSTALAEFPEPLQHHRRWLCPHPDWVRATFCSWVLGAPCAKSNLSLQGVSAVRAVHSA